MLLIVLKRITVDFDTYFKNESDVSYATHLSLDKALIKIKEELEQCFFTVEMTLINVVTIDELTKEGLYAGGIKLVEDLLIMRN